MRNRIDPTPRADQSVRSSGITIFLAITIATGILSWPSWVNRGPFFIADTTAYIRSADAGFTRYFSYDSTWSDKRDLYASPNQSLVSASEGGPAQQNGPTHPPLLGRSIYYGAFIYAPTVFFGEQAGVLVQSTLAALLLWMVLIPVEPCRTTRRVWRYLAVSVALGSLTSLPFALSLLVPDYLTGIACAALILLFCFWGSYSRGERALLSAMVILGSLSHSSNLPLLAGLGIAGSALRLLRFRIAWCGLAVGFGAVILGIASEAAFVAAVRHETGISPIRPPFLTARLIADGPGRRMMRVQCPRSAFEVCRYKLDVQLDSDTFLWSKGPNGVFSTSDFRSQKRLSDQDSYFAIETFREFPVQTMTSGFNSFVKQLGLLDYRIWATGPKNILENLPTPVAERMAKTLSIRGAMPVQPFQMIMVVVLLSAAACTPACLLKSRQSSDALVRSYGLALALVVLAIVLNAAITGALSKPDPRYNLRIVWLLPLFVGIHTFLRSKKQLTEPRE